MLRRHVPRRLECAAAGALADWEAAPDSALALSLLLDQVPRNISAPRRASMRPIRWPARRRPRDGERLRMLVRRRGGCSSTCRCTQREPRRPAAATALVASLPDRRDPERGGNRRYGLPYVDVPSTLWPLRTDASSRQSTQRKSPSRRSEPNLFKTVGRVQRGNPPRPPERCGLRYATPKTVIDCLLERTKNIIIRVIGGGMRRGL